MVMFENMARKPWFFFVFCFWGGSVVVPMWFSHVVFENRLRRKWRWNDPHRRAELESPSTPKCRGHPGSSGVGLSIWGLWKHQRWNEKIHLPWFKDCQMKKWRGTEKNSGETADSIQFQSIHPMQSTCENGLYPWKWMVFPRFSRESQGFPMERIPPKWPRWRLLEEQEKAYKAKISALEKRIKALEDEVKKLKVPWPSLAMALLRKSRDFSMIFHGKIRCDRCGGDWYFYGKTMKNMFL